MNENKLDDATIGKLLADLFRMWKIVRKWEDLVREVTVKNLLYGLQLEIEELIEEVIKT